MKKFEEPKLNVETIELEDVIATSTECETDCAGYTCEFDMGGFSLK